MMANLHLDLSFDHSPIGISQVSGFYGPGTWAAWYLTTISAWYNIIWKPHTGSTRNHNIILHLLVTNWAAIDVMRQIDKSRRAILMEEQTKINGSLAAAITVTYWGLCCALSQATACADGFSRNHIVIARLRKQWLILISGAVLPSIALTHIFYLVDFRYKRDLNSTLADTLPVFYWEDIDSLTHRLGVLGAAGLGFWSAIGLTITILVMGRKFVFLAHEERVISRLADLGISASQKAFSLSFGIGLLAFIFLVGSYHDISLRPLDIRGTYVIIVGGFVLWGVVLMTPFLLCGRYLLYFHWLPTRRSCFLMPCSPQSIGEWDQAFSLLAGAILLCMDIGPNIMRKFAKRYGRVERHGILGLTAESS